MNYFRFLSIAALLAASLSATALNIKVATVAMSPPMEIIDVNKQIVGYDIDFLNAIAKEAGIAVDFKNTAWDGIFAGLDSGQYDAIISSVTITDWHKAKYDCTDAYNGIGQILVLPKTDKTSNTIADLKGKKDSSQEQLPWHRT